MAWHRLAWLSLTPPPPPFLLGGSEPLTKLSKEMGAWQNLKRGDWCTNVHYVRNWTIFIRLFALQSFNDKKRGDQNFGVFNKQTFCTPLWMHIHRSTETFFLKQAITFFRVKFYLSVTHYDGISNHIAIT